MSRAGRPLQVPLENRPAWAQRLVSARRTVGYSQARLAELAEISQPALATYEIGKAEPSYATITRLARHCGVTPQWIVFGDVDEPPDKDTPVGAVIERYKDDAVFVDTFMAVAGMLRSEGFNADFRLITAVAQRLAEKVRSISDDSNVRGRIDAVVAEEQTKLRRKIWDTLERG